MLATMLRALPATKGFALLPRENRPARTSHVSEQKPSEDGRLKGREGTGPLLPEDAPRCERAPGVQGKRKQGQRVPSHNPAGPGGDHDFRQSLHKVPTQPQAHQPPPLLCSARASGVSSG